MQVSRLTLAALTLVVVAGCAGNPMPRWPSDEPVNGSRSAAALLAAAVEAQGGDLFESVADIAVRFEGRWGVLAPRLQPVLADRRYRRTSEERYLLDEGVVLQLHSGPAGAKRVLRQRATSAAPGETEVLYPHRDRAASEQQRRASALVADVYLMLTTGPSFFTSSVDAEWALLEPALLDGRTQERLRGRIRPGFGDAAHDDVVLWIDREERILRRVHFSLNGFTPAGGAEVDVTLRDHRRIQGFLWPTLFVERIREPLDLFAHRWRLAGLDLDRQLRSADVASLTPAATRPATAREASAERAEP